MLSQNYYIALGNLLYSVFYGDLLYKEMSLTEFFQKIKQHLIPAEEFDDEFGTNNSFYCIFEIERLSDLHADPFHAFSVFEDYYAGRKIAFPKKAKQEISSLIDEIKGKSDSKKPLTFVNKFQNL